MPEPLGRVLVADDQADILDALKLLLGGEGYEVRTARSPAELLAALEQSDVDVALIDLNYARDTTSGQEGFDLLDRMKAVDPTLPVLVMTGWSSVAGAVEAMRRGARDYIEKPWDDEALLLAVRAQLELRRTLRRGQRFREEHSRLDRRDLPAFIAEAPAMAAVKDTIERVAASDASVLITGEHGSGKEVVASLLHRLSTRASRPLVTMNAGGLSEGVAESELFGHVKGAFTDARTDRIGCFELADEGTLFLDEIANMPVRLQPKLLRVLQTGEVQRVGSARVLFVNVRVLSATNADLSAEISGGRFRDDLFYRLNTVIIPLPPLRDRREDILPLARHYLTRYASKYATGDRRIRSVRAAGTRGARLAGQRSRARPYRRTRRADGQDRRDRRRRSRPRCHERAAGRRDDPRAGGKGVHSESARAPRRRRP